jgi:hypothetical protein
MQIAAFFAISLNTGKENKPCMVSFGVFLQKTANRFGYRVTSLNLDADLVMKEDFEDLYQACKNYTMTSKERAYALYKGVEYVVRSGISGDIVECGVWKGGSSMLIARALMKFGDRKRKLFLYDTYAGMPEPSKEDLTVAKKSVMQVWQKGKKKGYNEMSYASLDEVKANMHSTGYPMKNIIFVKGKVEDTIPGKMPGQISLLRLDTDWYESTKHELVHLYPLLSQNGVLLIDDYGCYAGARKAVDAYFRKKPILLNRIDLTGRIGVKTE